MLYPTEKLILEGEIPVNCYVVQRNGECYIIDPGYQKEKIQKYIKDKGYKVKGILLTHAHIDHIEALDVFPVPIYLHKKEVKVLKNNALNGYEYFSKEPTYNLHDLKIHPLEDGNKVPLGEEEIEIVFTPGHSKGSSCYVIGHDIYTGDTLFENAVGRWDRPTANLEDLKKSVLMLVDRFPGHYLIHPSHGKSSTIEQENLHNPFIKSWRLSIDD